MSISRGDRFVDGFIGRKNELAELKYVYEGRTASLVVIKGRRRIGKSRLIEEFASQYKFYPFMGLAPRKGITAQDQRNEFIRQYIAHFGSYISHEEDWGNLFSFLAKQTQQGNIIILFDEISWMASNDPDFLGKLKIIWDCTLECLLESLTLNLVKKVKAFAKDI